MKIWDNTCTMKIKTTGQHENGTKEEKFLDLTTIWTSPWKCKCNKMSCLGFKERVVELACVYFLSFCIQDLATKKLKENPKRFFRSGDEFKYHCSVLGVKCLFLLEGEKGCV